PPIGCRLIENPSTVGPGVARNSGAQAAEGRFLLFLDDDMVAGARLVAAHLAAQRAEPLVVTIGSIVLTASRRPDGFTRYFEQTWSRRYRQFGDGCRIPGWRDCYGGDLWVRRDLFLGGGGVRACAPPARQGGVAFRL